MSCEAFCQGNSLLHRADPRGKIVVAGAFSVVVAVMQLFPPLYVAAAGALCFALLARLPLPRVLSRLLVVNGFVLFLWVFLPWSGPGPVLFSIGPLSAHTEGIRLAALITLKANTLVLTLLALVATSTMLDLGRAMERLGVPGKLVHLLLFTYRYIDVIEQEYHRLTAAMRARAFVPAGNLYTFKSYAWLVGMLLVRSYDRSQRVHQAMLCRGFSRRFHTLHRHVWSARDTFFVATGLCFTLLLGAMTWML